MRALTIAVAALGTWTALVAGAHAQASAPRGGAFIVVPHPAGDVYVPLDPSGQPLFPAVPSAPPSPGAPATPPVPPAADRPTGYLVVPPAARDAGPPPTGGGYHVVPRP